MQKKLTTKQIEWLVLVKDSADFWSDHQFIQQNTTWNSLIVKRWIDSILKAGKYENDSSDVSTDKFWLRDLRKTWIEFIINENKR